VFTRPGYTLEKNLTTPIVWERLNLASKRTVDEIREAEIYRLKVSDTFRTLFKEYSFIAMPCTFGPAVTKAALTSQHRECLLALNAPASLAGLPLVVAPVQLENGLTAGVQFIFSDMAHFAWEDLLAQLS
jgi:Asp-tRNA(Asn)/Glu-tRNA(Gln) amidotransferase A subunit family amidase